MIHKGFFISMLMVLLFSLVVLNFEFQSTRAHLVNEPSYVNVFSKSIADEMSIVDNNKVYIEPMKYESQSKQWSRLTDRLAIVHENDFNPKLTNKFESSSVTIKINDDSIDLEGHVNNLKIIYENEEKCNLTSQGTITNIDYVLITNYEGNDGYEGYEGYGSYESYEGKLHSHITCDDLSIEVLASTITINGNVSLIEFETSDPNFKTGFTLNNNIYSVRLS